MSQQYEPNYNHHNAPRLSGHRIHCDTSTGVPASHQFGSHTGSATKSGLKSFVGSVILKDSVHPGRILEDGQVYATFEGKGNPTLCQVAAHTLFTSPEQCYQVPSGGKYDFMTYFDDDMEWIPATHGYTPDGHQPIVGGYEKDGKLLYHALGQVDSAQEYEGGWLLGVTAPHLGGARFAYQYKEHKATSGYKILCWRDDRGPFTEKGSRRDAEENAQYIQYVSFQLEEPLSNFSADSVVVQFIDQYFEALQGKPQAPFPLDRFYVGLEDAESTLIVSVGIPPEHEPRGYEGKEILAALTLDRISDFEFLTFASEWGQDRLTSGKEACSLLQITGNGMAHPHDGAPYAAAYSMSFVLSARPEPHDEKERIRFRIMTQTIGLTRADGVSHLTNKMERDPAFKFGHSKPDPKWGMGPSMGGGKRPKPHDWRIGPKSDKDKGWIPKESDING
ncbi:hypothetical protein P7C70_g5416, partial [Phenoliferia sp. Uapishka_3]